MNNKNQSAHSREELKKVVGQRINGALAAKKVKQKDLAAYLDVKSENTVSYWCKGERMPSLIQLSKMADFFDLPVDYLLGRTKSKAPVDNDVTFLIDRFGFSQKAARELTILSIPANGEKAQRRFAALNKLLEQPEIEAILYDLYLCMSFGENITLYEGELIKQDKYPAHVEGQSTNEEIIKKADRQMYRSGTIYNPVFLLHKIAERLVKQSEKEAADNGQR